MAKKDYYEILGVKSTDSNETIKKNYKLLALKYHPDKAAPEKKKEYEEKFKEINEAYSTIGDEGKRRKYDSGETAQNFGGGGFSQSQGFGGEDLSDILSNLFGGGSFRNASKNQGGRRRGEDLSYEITIEFTEAAYGCEKEIIIKKDYVCENCEGSGSEDKEYDKCETCNGHGRLRISQKTPFGIMNQTIICEKCEGAGKIPKNKCTNCEGEGIINKKEKIKIKIPAGIDNGQTLRVVGGGQAIKNGEEGDLFLTVNVKEHKVFNRTEFDIHMDLEISFSKAALGGEVAVTTLKGELLRIKISKGTQTGSVLRLAGRGIPILNNNSKFGDQFIKIIVKTPKKLTKKQTKIFEELAKLEEE
ncbi:MAG: J domain-containing protein [Nanoarchaeota archaeon]